jgi:hypothetical protein
MALLLTALAVIGGAGLSLGLLFSLLAQSRLLVSLKRLEQDTFVRLGSPTGMSPPDPSSGTRGMQRYIFAAEYRGSPHKEVRLYGGRARLGGLVAMSGLLVLVFVTLVRSL